MFSVVSYTRMVSLFSRATGRFTSLKPRRALVAAKVLPAIVLLPVVMATEPVLAAKMYKTVDENGRVSFSQFPPVEKKENAVVSSMKVSGGIGDTPVTDGSDGYLYCGQIVLPGKVNAEPVRNSHLESRRRDWKYDLKRLERRLSEKAEKDNENFHKRRDYNYNYRNRRDGSLGTAQGSRSHYDKEVSRRQAYDERKREETAELISNIRDLKCALAWADNTSKEKKSSSNYAESKIENKNYRANLEKYQRVLGSLKENRRNTCGQEPVNDPTDPAASQTWGRWKSCSKRFMKDIDMIERKVRQIKKKLRRDFDDFGEDEEE